MPAWAASRCAASSSALRSSARSQKGEARSITRPGFSTLDPAPPHECPARSRTDWPGAQAPSMSEVPTVSFAPVGLQAYARAWDRFLRLLARAKRRFRRTALFEARTRTARLTGESIRWHVPSAALFALDLVCLFGERGSRALGQLLERLLALRRSRGFLDVPLRRSALLRACHDRAHLLHACGCTRRPRNDTVEIFDLSVRQEQPLAVDNTYPSSCNMVSGFLTRRPSKSVYLLAARGSVTLTVEPVGLTMTRAPLYARR